MGHPWNPEHCWTTRHLRHSYPSDWFKVFLCLASIKMFECLALVVCHKGPLSQLPNLSRRIQQKEDRDPAVVVPKVTCDLPLAPVPFQMNWKHLADLDPGFGQPGHIDMLLGVNLFLDVLCHGRRSGPLESPTALETEFGWVLHGSAGPASCSSAHACEPLSKAHLLISSDNSGRLKKHQQTTQHFPQKNEQ